MKKIALPILLFSFYCATAQKEKQVVVYDKALHVSPLALLQVDFTAMAGGEYRLKPNLGLGADIGYIFGSAYFVDQLSQKASGFVFRPSVRFYSGSRNNFYMQPQL